MSLSRVSRFAFLPVAMLFAAAVGCGPSYSDQRPPLDELDSRDRGLQSKDVLAASDQMAMELLALPELNDSPERWTVVVRDVEDNTSGRRFSGRDYDVFIERLRVNLAQQGRGRIRLIENKERFYDIRERELEEEREDFGQGERPGGQAPQAVQPNFALYGKAMDLPGRGTTYYNIQFDLVDLRTREQVWNGQYEVRVARK